MTGYTKGPWAVSVLTADDPNGDEWETDVEVTAGKTFIHGHDLGYSDMADATIKANAHLIAAAPEMYEALRRQTDNMAFMLNHLRLPDQWFEKFNLELEEDRAALAKAEGKS